MPALKDIQEAFGGDPRFRLIGLSCDRTAEAGGTTTSEQNETELDARIRRQPRRGRCRELTRSG